MLKNNRSDRVMMVQKGAPERLDQIQVLRGVAAFLVLILHLLQRGSDYAPCDVRAHIEWMKGGVDLFFVISGFVMAHSVRNLSRPEEAGIFLVRRFWRIAPVLYLVALVYIPLAGHAGRYVSLANVINCFVIVPIFPTPDRNTHVLGPAWSLGLEVLFYLVVASVVAARIRYRNTALIGLLGLMMLIPGMNLVLRDNSYPLMLEFALGVGVYALWVRGWLTRSVSRLSLALGFVLLLGLVLHTGGDVSPDVRIRLLQLGGPSVFLFAGAIGLPVAGNVVARAWLALGDISYSLYLAHIVAIDTAFLLLRDHLSYWALTAAMLASALGFGVLVYRTVEAPMLRASRAIGSGRQVQTVAAS